MRRGSQAQCCWPEGHKHPCPDPVGLPEPLSPSASDCLLPRTLPSQPPIPVCLVESGLQVDLVAPKTFLGSPLLRAVAPSLPSTPQFLQVTKAVLCFPPVCLKGCTMFTV